MGFFYLFEYLIAELIEVTGFLVYAHNIALVGVEPHTPSHPLSHFST